MGDGDRRKANRHPGGVDPAGGPRGRSALARRGGGLALAGVQQQQLAADQAHDRKIGPFGDRQGRRQLRSAWSNCPAAVSRVPQIVTSVTLELQAAGVARSPGRKTVAETGL
jgi:hypothetical protein